MNHRVRVIDACVAKEDWKGMHDAITTAINKGQLDVWYDVDSVLQAVHRADFDCYTCFLKHHGVLCRAYDCIIEGRWWQVEIAGLEEVEKQFRHRCTFEQVPQKIVVTDPTQLELF